MTKGQKNYENGKIYKLVDENGYFYIGSTCRPLYKRLSAHKSDSKLYPERKIYKYFNEIGWENIQIILITDEVPIDNVEQLHRLENEYIEAERHNSKCLNFKRSFSTIETKKQTKHEYVLNHKEEIKVYNQAYSKNYREINKDAISKQHKEYREKNQEKIKTWFAQEYICPLCNHSMKISSKSRHEESQKHLKKIAKTI